MSDLQGNDYLKQTAQILKDYDPTTEEGQHNAATLGKQPLTPGAYDWQYVPDYVAQTFRYAIANSNDPEDTESRLQSAWFLSKMNGSTIQDEWDNLDVSLANWRAEKLSPRSAGEAIANTWRASFLGAEINKLSYQLYQKSTTGEVDWTRLEADPLYAKILELEAQMPPPDVIKRSLPTKALQALGQFAPSALESMRAGAAGGAVGMIGTAALATAAGIADAASLGTLTVPLIALMGFSVGSATAGQLKSQELEAGSAFYELMRFQDPNTGARINPGAATLWAGMYGGAASVVEMLQFGSFFKALSAPVRKALGEGGEAAVKKAAVAALHDVSAKAERVALAQRAMGAFIAGAKSKAGAGAIDLASETLQEVSQQAMQLGANEFARQVTERLDMTQISPATAREVRDSIVETAVGAALGMGVAKIIPGSFKLFLEGGATATRVAQAQGVMKAEEAPVIGNATPEEAEVFNKRAAEPIPEGAHIQKTEEIEGEQYVLKLGDAEGKRLGSVRFEFTPPEGEATAGTVDILGFEKGMEPNAQVALAQAVGRRFPGWTVNFEPKTPLQAALRDFLISHNPNGPEAGINHFEASLGAVDKVTVQAVRERFKALLPAWDDDQLDIAARWIPAWAREIGMAPDELAEAMIDPHVTGRLLDRSAAGQAAQGATGAARGIRQADGRIKSLIDMAPRANPSTAMHELTHAVVWFMRDNQHIPQVEAALKRLEAAMGIKDGAWEAEWHGWTENYPAGWNRNGMEALSYGLEDYFATGKAPKPELEGLFQKMARWVLELYQALKGARVQMSPEMTAYFDNLVGGEGSPFLEASTSEATLKAEPQKSATNSVKIAPGEAGTAGAGAVADDEEELEIFQGGPQGTRRAALQDLEDAQRLVAAGQDPKAVKAQTGWFQEDGEWRRADAHPTRQDFSQPAELQEQERAAQTPYHTPEGGTFKVNRQPLYQGEPADYWLYKSEETIRAKLQGAQPGKSILKMLQAAGVKEDELRWTGLDEYLAMDEKRKPEEVLAFLEANKLKIEEATRKDDKELERAVYKLDNELREYNVAIHVAENEMRDREIKSEEWVQLAVKRMALDKEREKIIAKREAASARYRSIGLPKYSDLALPGGENYREVLFTLPSRTIYQALGKDMEWIDFDNSTDRNEYVKETYGDEALTQRPGLTQEIIIGWRYWSSHWSETPNVLAHTRLNDRTDAQGRRMLFVEEIQSDWLQALRAGKNVPDAPFKKTWHEFVFKRILREACENDYEAIGWTTGEQQSDRYNLRKTIENARYNKTRGFLDVRRVGGFTQELVASDIGPEKIEEYIGKDAAKAILSAEPDENGWQTISGLDLKIGGEGMAGFYDKMLVDYANKLGKKWGAKVEEGHLDAGEYHLVEAGTGVSDGRILASGFVSEMEADDYARGHKLSYYAVEKTPSIVHSLPITNEMRASVMQGLYLFQGAPKEASFATLDEENIEERTLYSLTGIYHGGGVGFTRFDHSYMGTGEGQQVYGWGTYASENKGTARDTYAKKLGTDPELRLGGTQINEDLIIDALRADDDGTRGWLYVIQAKRIIEPVLEQFYKHIKREISKDKTFPTLDKVEQEQLVEIARFEGWDGWDTSKLKLDPDDKSIPATIRRAEQQKARLLPIIEQAIKDTEEEFKYLAGLEDDDNAKPRLQVVEEIKSSFENAKEAGAIFLVGGHWLYELDVETGNIEADPAKPAGKRWNTKLTQPTFEKIADQNKWHGWGEANFLERYAAAPSQAVIDAAEEEGMAVGDLMGGMLENIRDKDARCDLLGDAATGEALWKYLTETVFGNESLAYAVLSSAGIRDIFPGEGNPVYLTPEMLIRGEVDLGTHIGDYTAGDIYDFYDSVIPEPTNGLYPDHIASILKMVVDTIENKKLPPITQADIDHWQDAGDGTFDPAEMTPAVKKHSDALTEIVMNRLEILNEHFTSDGDERGAAAAKAVYAYFSGPDDEAHLFLRPNAKTPQPDAATQGRWIRWDQPVPQRDINRISEAMQRLQKEDVETDGASTAKIFDDDINILEDFDGPLEDLASAIPMYETWEEGTGHPITGRELYENIADQLGSPKAASLFLHYAGFHGNKMPVAFLSGGKGEKGFNYVVFSDKLMTIRERFLYQGAPIEGLKPAMAAAAQEVYDAWEQQDDEPGGGICDEIASEIGSILSAAGWDITDGGWDGDDHAYVIAYDERRAFVVDIPPHVYETGGGYSWRKKPGVTFSEAHIVVEPLERSLVEETLYQGEFGEELPVTPGDTKTAIGILESLHTPAVVERAVIRAPIGDIAIPWGNPGDAARGYKGGYGLAKIIGKHEAAGEEVLARLADILNRGAIWTDPVPGHENRVLFMLDGFTAVVMMNRDFDGKHIEGAPWLLTAYKDLWNSARGTNDTRGGAQLIASEEPPAGATTISPSASQAEGGARPSEPGAVSTVPPRKVVVKMKRKPGSLNQGEPVSTDGIPYLPGNPTGPLTEIERQVLTEAGRPMREAVARSQRALFQGDDQDEPGIASAKEIARTFGTWEEFMEYMESPFMEEERKRIPLDDEPDKEKWYEALWKKATMTKVGTLEEWADTLEAENHKGLYAFLQGIWNEILLPNATMQLEDEEEAAQVDAAREKAGSIKDELAESIVSAAQRVGGKNRTDLDSRFLASIMGVIRANPEEYARIYGQVMGDPRIGDLGAAAETEKYADIADPKLRSTRLSISQRAAMAAQIRDEKLAADVLAGRVQMDDRAKEYVKKLRASEKAAQEQVKQLRTESKETEAALTAQEKGLAAARVSRAQTLKEIEQTKARIERYVEKGQKAPANLQEKLASQKKRAETLRRQLAAAGDWQALESRANDLEARLTRTEMVIQQAQAAGERPDPSLLRRRSEAAAELRTVKAKMAASKARWTSSAALQTHLAKIEASAKAKDEAAVAQAERRALQKLRAHQNKLAKSIMKPVSDKTYVAQARAIQAIQAMIDPHRRSERTQEQINLLRDELERNPDLASEVSRDWLKRAAAKNLNEMTLEDLENTARVVDNLRSMGRALKAAQDREQQEWADARINRIVDIIMQSPGYREPTGYEAEKTFIEKLKDKVRSSDYAFLSMRRIANKLDGGTDGTNVELLWHEMNRKYRAEMEGVKRRTDRLLAAIEETGADVDDWYNTKVSISGVGPGRSDKTFRKADILALYLALKNEDSRQAAVFGNFFSVKEKKQMTEEELLFEGSARLEKIQAAIDATVTPQDLKALQAFEADAAETAPRLSDVVAAVQNRILEVVDNYFPMMREGVTQEPLDVQLGAEMLNRTPGLRRPVAAGFAKTRIKISPKHQGMIKLDLLSTWMHSIQAQEHYIATAAYAKKLDAVYTNPFMQEQIKALLGDPGVDYVKEYIAEVKNPGELRNSSRWENAIRYLRGNLGAAYLTFKASSALKQVITSPWPTAAYAGPRMLSETFRCLANPPKFLRETEAMSTYLANRSMDVVVDALKRATAEGPAGKALVKINRAGVKGLELADRFSVAIVWRAVFEKEMAKVQDVTKATEAADDAVMKTQPSARGVDLAPIYRKGGEALRLLLQFTQALNVIWQNIRYDVPNGLKNHQYATAIGTIVSYMIAGVLLGAATGRPPEGETPEEKRRRLMFYMVTQGTDSIPLIGQDATRIARRLITGEKEPEIPDTALPGINYILDSLYNLSGEEYDKALKNFASGAGMVLGMPVSGIKEFSRVINGDAGALLGKPRE